MYYHEQFKPARWEPHSKTRDLTVKEPTKDEWPKSSERWSPTAYSCLSVKSVVLSFF